MPTEAQKNFSTVRRLRAQAEKLRGEWDLGQEEYQGIQNVLGAKDREYAAEAVAEENPLRSLSWLAAIPGEHIAKSLGLTSGRSQPTLESLAGAYRGLGRGLNTSRERLIASILRTPQQRPDGAGPALQQPPSRLDPLEWKRQLQKHGDQLERRDARSDLENFREDYANLNR